MITIKIKDLELFANHGVLKEENALGQKFVISVEIDLHTRKTDLIDETINYAAVCEFTERFMRENTFALIETAAEELARGIIVNFPGAVRVKTEIKKPWAPIKMNVSYVSASTEQKWRRAFISIGSNLGDRRRHINNALDKIRENPFCKLRQVSDFIETEPVGYKNQNDFLNGCAEIETLFAPFELLDFLHECENSDGRTREIHWGPRTIDLDIIYYEDIILETEELTIPHKEMAKRRFVLEPLAQIAPNILNPLNGCTPGEMLERLT